MHGHILQHVDSTKYLGLSISKNLSQGMTKLELDIQIPSRVEQHNTFFID
jgi:hypothetical protein